jgi:hypothetical protein
LGAGERDLSGSGAATEAPLVELAVAAATVLVLVIGAFLLAMGESLKTI